MELNYIESPGAVPATYTLPPGQSFELESVSASFDGAGASGSFLACLSVYSQDSKLIFRAPVDQVLASGDSAEVSFYPLADQAASAATGAGSIPVCYLWDDTTHNFALAAGASLNPSFNHFTPFGIGSTTTNQDIVLDAGEAVYQFDCFFYAHLTAGVRTIGDIVCDIEFMTAAFAMPAISANSPVNGAANDMVVWARMYDGITSSQSYVTRLVNVSGANAYQIRSRYFIVTRLYATTP